MSTAENLNLEHPEIWRRQCARHLMDCYALAMGTMNGPWEKTGPGHAALESLTRLMVDGMTAVREPEDEKAFYLTAAASCRECAGAGGEKARLFRIYGAIFEGMAESLESAKAGGKP